jgi:hypothetical protein
VHPTHIYDVAFLGHYIKYTIVSASGARVVDGGTFNYGAHVAAYVARRLTASPAEATAWAVSKWKPKALSVGRSKLSLVPDAVDRRTRLRCRVQFVWPW